MDHLLDTNALLFFLEDSPRLISQNAKLIESPQSMSIVSMASLWEISLKASLGKLQISYGDDPDLPKLLHEHGFEIIEITWPAMNRSCGVPRHHRAPFDRLLIAE